MPTTAMTSNNPTRPESQVAGSFRDPNGFVFRKEGVLYRQVNERYAPNYDLSIRN